MHCHKKITSKRGVSESAKIKVHTIDYSIKDEKEVMNNVNLIYILYATNIKEP